MDRMDTAHQPTFDLEVMTQTELYQLGNVIGSVATHRPDILHCILVGLKHRLEAQNLHPWLGEFLNALHARAIHSPEIAGRIASAEPYVGFRPLNPAPSGTPVAP